MSDLHTIKKKWLREGKKACFEKDWCQGTGEQLYRRSGADDSSCLGNRSSLPVALNCPARQWTIISARWKWDQYLLAGVGLHRLSPYLSDCPQGLLVTLWVIYCAGGQTRPLKFVKRTGQRCVPAQLKAPIKKLYFSVQRMLAAPVDDISDIVNIIKRCNIINTLFGSKCYQIYSK